MLIITNTFNICSELGFFTYNGQYKDGLSQNISALRYWNSDHYPSVEKNKKDNVIM